MQASEVYLLDNSQKQKYFWKFYNYKTFWFRIFRSALTYSFNFKGTTFWSQELSSVLKMIRWNQNEVHMCDLAEHNSGINVSHESRVE